MKRKGAAVSVSLAIFAFIATLSIVEVGLDSFVNIDELVQAATIELQATRFTTAAYAASAMDDGGMVELQLNDDYTIYASDNNLPSDAEAAMDEDDFVRPDDSYTAVIHTGDDGYAPIGYGHAAFSGEETSDTWCINANGDFEPGGCS